MDLASSLPSSLQVVDSHTEGEPTRVVVDGWPDLSSRDPRTVVETLRREHDPLRRAVVCEPRGHDAVVGALLLPPSDDETVAGVVFFNNVGTLGMCGHGLIGVVQTLQHLGRLAGPRVQLDTPVGRVAARVGEDGAVTIENVASYCELQDVEIAVEGLGSVVGDVAWGGNWFFLTHLPDEELSLKRLPELLAATQAIRDTLDSMDLLGGGGHIDHVELSGPPTRADADGKNFVLCPGGEYDRSPCGTGTSAKLAALHARGQLAVGQKWRQESITGGRFVGWLTEREGKLIPRIRGHAHVVAEGQLLFDPDDPLRGGFSARVE